MKICAIICEFNPFHNGHKRLIAEAKRLSGCDAVLCVMSGSFTQRGDICSLSKFARAKHAIHGGADMVIEIPVHFSVAPAEVFATGAIKTAMNIDGVDSLAFGCENPSDFSALARRAIDESDKFKEKLSENLNAGMGYAAAYSAAFGEGAPTTPNDILALEYAKANIRLDADLFLYGVRREGSGHNDNELCGEYASSSAIRANRKNRKIYDFAPREVCDELMYTTDNEQVYKEYLKTLLFVAKKDRLRRIYGCTEGLENRLKKLSVGLSYDEIVNKCCSKRYSKTRIKRILCANALNLFADDTEELLKTDLPAEVLAVKKERASELLPLVKKVKDAGYYAGCSHAISTASYTLWKFLTYPDSGNDINGKTKLV